MSIQETSFSMFLNISYSSYFSSLLLSVLSIGQLIRSLLSLSNTQALDGQLKVNRMATDLKTSMTGFPLICSEGSFGDPQLMIPLAKRCPPDPARGSTCLGSPCGEPLPQEPGHDQVLRNVAQSSLRFLPLHFFTNSSLQELRAF